MDVAYDKVQEDAYPEDAPPQDAQQKRERTMSNDLNTEVKEALTAFQNSSWGSSLGGLWGAVKKQGESYFEGARKELTAANVEASKKGVTDLISNTQVLTVAEDGSARDTKEDIPKAPASAKVPDSLPADILREAGSLVNIFRSEAGARLKQVQKAEDAADKALLKFGTNIRDYLKEAITITAPAEGGDGGVKSVLFESKDAEGRRVVHATRFDAQLHVIHSTPLSFNQDPGSEEYAMWKEDFDVEKKTDAIAQDLAKYDDLRRAMEKLVPETVNYPTFWTRYYFLRHVIEEQEHKRRELLKGTQTEDEEIRWDDDDEEDKSPATPKMDASRVDAAETPKRPPVQRDDTSPGENLKPVEGRRSNENSIADSDASYDLVSGQASRGPGSPKEEKDKKKAGAAAEQSDEEDWE